MFSEEAWPSCFCPQPSRVLPQLQRWTAQRRRLNGSLRTRAVDLAAAAPPPSAAARPPLTLTAFSAPSGSVATTLHCGYTQESGAGDSRLVSSAFPTLPLSEGACIASSLTSSTVRESAFSCTENQTDAFACISDHDVIEELLTESGFYARNCSVS